MNGHIFETFAISEILKSYENSGLDYRHYVSYYRTHGRKTRSQAGEKVEIDGGIDFIIEENGVLHPLKIKQSGMVSADVAAMFRELDKAEGKERGTGAVICNSSHPGTLRDNVLLFPVWYI